MSLLCRKEFIKMKVKNKWKPEKANMTNEYKFNKCDKTKWSLFFKGGVFWEIFGNLKNH